MGLDIFLPAPPGLPVPVNPSRGSDEVLQLLRSTDWSQVLQLRSDRLVRAGALWLFGFLDEAHLLAQQDPSPEGAYWHALVHRSEGDFSNALYWFNRVGGHSLHVSLKVEVQETVKERSWKGWKTLVEGPRWNPTRFVELCEQSARGELGEPSILQRIAQLEYNLLMAFVVSEAKS